MEEPNFGVFIEFWNGHPNHLPLLSLNQSDNDPKEWNLIKSFERIDYLFLTYTQKEIIKGITKLLINEDWRPHLVASLSILKLQKSEQIKTILKLWERIQKGSWVSPQMLAILSIIDLDFIKTGKEILENGFEIDYSKMKNHEHHSARGPAGKTVDNNKVLAAIEYLINGNIIDSAENDGGSSIAKSWKSKLMELIKTNKFIIDSKLKKRLLME